MNTLGENSNEKLWSPQSWRNFKISQQPEYKDVELLESIKNKVII